MVASLAFASSTDDLSGFTLTQLNAALNKSGVATGKLYSILTFDSEDRDGANIAVLSGSHTGWHLAILHRTKGGLSVQWRSGNLPKDFSVSSSRNMIIKNVGDEQVVEFSGCAPHDCGGLDGVQGVLLYSLESNQVFFAHYRFDDQKPIGSFGSLEFSDDVLRPANERYKNALEKQMNGILGR